MYVCIFDHFPMINFLMSLKDFIVETKTRFTNTTAAVGLVPARGTMASSDMVLTKSPGIFRPWPSGISKIAANYYVNNVNDDFPLRKKA